MQLNSKSEVVVRAGMVFNVALGLENVEDKEATDKRAKTCAPPLRDAWPRQRPGCWRVRAQGPGCRNGRACTLFSASDSAVALGANGGPVA
eukprot:2083921-Prymnesium_polylepis.1